MKLEFADLDGSLAYADFGGEGPPIVCVHGLGGNHANWIPSAPLLTKFGRVLAPDLPGFGKTPPHGRSSSLPANRLILDRFIREVAGAPAIVIGNSMGGLLSIMQSAAAPDTVSAAVLVCPAVPRAPGTLGDPLVVGAFAVYSTPYAGEALLRRRYRRLGPEGIVMDTFRICSVDVNRIPKEAIDASIEIARWRSTKLWPAPAYLEAARSLVRILARRNRFFEMAALVKAPVLIVQGAKDRLVPLTAVRALAARMPSWKLRVLDDIGHIPMLEASDAFAQAVGEWLTAGTPGLKDASSV